MRCEVRPAWAEEFPAVMGVLDAALLETDPDEVRAAIDEGSALVAVEGERVLGACVLSGSHVAAIAVRPRRRGQGIGAALIEAAAERRGRLTADFDARVRPFYESLGFEIERDGGRFRGTWRPD